MEKMTTRQITIIKFIFARIFPLPFIIVGAVLLYYGVKGVLIAVDSRGWPQTNATVISSSVKSYSSSAAKGRTQHQGVIHYEFFVQKSRYIGYHSNTSPDAGEAASLIERHPKGKQITVYYMPGNPAECLLEPGLKGKTLIMPAGGLILFVPGILMAIFLPGLMKKAGQINEQGTPQDAA
jgi:hypothetical protein